ncbi:OsmC family protein [Thermosyntropha sp.]|uniref:OsmC family protein n=1 Tax=Thermosyntropha sp. TaxID=2740820 RepID=UPI0025CF2BC6|nr:OsmC family protein [Thermosyntropha sp.]MBO8158974.1 OsmC family protein [Thermosyntropha sp.]
MAADQPILAEVAWQHEGIKSIAEVAGQKVIMDSPVESGGTGEGPTPLQILPASLGGCIIAMIAIVGKKKRMEINDIKVKVEANIENGNVKEIKYQVKVDANAPEDQIEKLIEQAAAICPVKNALGIPVTRIM